MSIMDTREVMRLGILSIICNLEYLHIVNIVMQRLTLSFNSCLPHVVEKYDVREYRDSGRIRWYSICVVSTCYNNIYIFVFEYFLFHLLR
jgi:hypothetical protein